MVATRSTLVALLAGSLAACLPPPLKDCSDTGCSAPPATETETGTQGPDVPTTSGDTDDVQTLTGDPAPGSTGDTTTTAGDPSTGEPALPPTITKTAASPGVLEGNGAIEVDAFTEHADAVRMTLKNGDIIDLAPAGPDHFQGQIEVLTGEDNGEQEATLVPWRGDEFGAEEVLKYTVLLPEPGAQLFWEAGDLIGAGKVVALDLLPDGLLVEFGTLLVNNESRCYLRRRQLDGTWFEADFIEVLPGSECTAIDMKIDPEVGTMHVLVYREGGDGKRWWLGEIASWGKGIKNIGLGAKDDQAEALAQAPGVVAVCGARPLTLDIDAAAWLHRPNHPVEMRLFDFKNEDFNPHEYDETARDCAFAGPVLVLVGEVFGPLTQFAPHRNHRLVLEHDTSTNSDTWTVAGPGQGTQSRALAVDIDDQGRYLVAGISCDDSCEPDGEIRIYDPGGALAWQAPLGPVNNELAGPNDIAWSPAGHIIVALAELEGETLRFKVEAFAPGVFEPLWTFFPEDAQGLQIALALVIGDLGEVYAGGIGADNYPAVAYIAG